jgi:hypothetical protein
LKRESELEAKLENMGKEMQKTLQEKEDLAKWKENALAK